MVITQKSKDQVWQDESGTRIPYNRTTKSERLNERLSAKLLKEAQKLNANLVAFKELVNDSCQKAFDAYMEEKDVKVNRKGNYTWYNFNRSIKVEVNVNERIQFDDMGVTAAKEKLDEFLAISLNGKDDIIRQLINSAFETTRGKLDTKKVMNLIRYKSKVKDSLFNRAIELLEGAIRKPESKTYFRIYLRDEDGKYQNIDLNFSSI